MPKVMRLNKEIMEDLEKLQEEYRRKGIIVNEKNLIEMGLKALLEPKPIDEEKENHNH